ncbi:MULTISPECIES: TMEM175 family protein [Silvimonas]|uniref:TMEM175 family protein n=1 Tax=Silvimonas TaxID=300264 RepID=UPI0024B35C4A|nr:MULTISPECIES: TMEM175 family protein [Silvimonas]MDR3426281.1 TMEM175 family protein [Silvimonas sp.]
MGKGRLEAFSDGVLAIIITIMVLELKVPHGTDPHALLEMWPVLLSYILSFIYVGIYWNNHHHLFHAVTAVSGGVLWANLHLLFWLSLIPVTTAWLGENGLMSWPAALYGVVLLGSAIAYFILTRVLVAHHGRQSLLAQSLGSDVKGRISVVLYALGVGLAFVHGAIACILYTVVAVVWLIPDRRFERSADQVS